MLNALAAYVESNVFSPQDEVVHAGEVYAGAMIMSMGIAEAVDIFKRNKVMTASCAPCSKNSISKRIIYIVKSFSVATRELVDTAPILH